MLLELIGINDLLAVNNLIMDKLQVVVMCIGTMKVVGDSVGPRVGDILKADGIDCYVYGDSVGNINACKLDVYEQLLRACHAGDIVIAVDAALGDKDDVGKIKVVGNGLRPGKALGRSGNPIGDIGVLAVVGERSEDNFATLASGSVRFIETMAEKAAATVHALVRYIGAQAASAGISYKAVATP